jgi:hypothetical protein
MRRPVRILGIRWDMEGHGFAKIKAPPPEIDCNPRISGNRFRFAGVWIRRTAASSSPRRDIDRRPDGDWKSPGPFINTNSLMLRLQDIGKKHRRRGMSKNLKKRFFNPDMRDIATTTDARIKRR